MARATGRLTALKVEKAKKPGMYPDGGGLYLRVTRHGARNWVFRYMLDRRPHWMGLGPLSLYGLHEARTKAFDARRKRFLGKPTARCDEETQRALCGIGRNLIERPSRLLVKDLDGERVPEDGTAFAFLMDRAVGRCSSRRPAGLPGAHGDTS